VNVSRELFPASHRHVMKDVSRYKATRNEADSQHSAMRVSCLTLGREVVNSMEGCFGVVLGLCWGWRLFVKPPLGGSGAERGTGACRVKLRVRVEVTTLNVFHSTV